MSDYNIQSDIGSIILEKLRRIEEAVYKILDEKLSLERLKRERQIADINKSKEVSDG